jgi:1-acyl-sn-glycerol-3-phosphate acyltransferase
MLRRIEGIENIPDKPPFIVISNHERQIDPLLIIYLILSRLDKKIHFIATPRYWFLGEKICRNWAGCIPLFNSKQAFKEAKNLINMGEIVGVFPEGHLKGSREIKTGAIRLSIETSAPILPIRLQSSYAPLMSKLYIGKLIHINSRNNLKKQATGLMNCIYRL